MTLFKKKNAKNGDVINVNNISTYFQAYENHGDLTEKFSMLITI